MNTKYRLGCIVALALLGTVFSPAVRADITVETYITNLFEPYAVAAEPDGTSYVTDSSNNRIVKVAAGTSMGSVLAGTAGATGTNDGIGTAARFSAPQGIVVARGGVIVADSANHTLRYITNGIVTTIAGAAGVAGYVDGPGASARFRYPAGLAADDAGNVYIADSYNNVIRKLDLNNVVTTVATGLLQPAGVSVGGHGELWIADTRRHCIRVLDTNGVMRLIAGTAGVSGVLDSSVATNALFTLPRGVLWLGDLSGVLVTDSGNNTIRRIYYNSSYGTYSVETYAGLAGAPGMVNGPALSAKFNSPIGITRDQLSGGFLVADKGNNQVRRVNTGAVQPPVANPILGYIEIYRDSFGGYVTRLVPVIASVFNNDVRIGIKAEGGTSTYVTYGDTPPSSLEDDIPNPGPGSGISPPIYLDGTLPGDLPQTIVGPQPDITLKAIGTQDGRRSSQIVQARFQFKVGNPLIGGDNAASFTVDDVTDGAQIYYTWDGSEPTNNPASNPAVRGPIQPGDSISFRMGPTNQTFKVKAFKANYFPSDTITKTFSPSNFVANTISFGFDVGEGSSAFIAAPGQRFYVPVTLNVLPGQRMYSLQFDAYATNLTGPPIDSTKVGFSSLLKKPIGAFDPNRPLLMTIPPAMPVMDETSVTRTLLITNPAINLLSVGWLERRGFTNLYNSLNQDLITYSMAHDTLFMSSEGKVLVGAYSFVVPPSAPQGSTYQITLDRPSATSDGVREDVFVAIPTNGAVGAGAINGIKTVTVASQPYLVGDIAPFRWYNAGDFGDGKLLNNDVLQIFQSAVYFLNAPPPGSDFFGGMDASDGSVNTLGLIDGSNSAIDQIRYGDGILAIDDVYVTYRRSLDPSLKWFARYWSNSALQVVEVPNTYGASIGSAAAPAPAIKTLSAGARVSLAAAADDVVAAAGATVQVPIRVHINGTRALKMAMLNVTVEALDGAPEITNGVTMSSALGTPTMSSSLAGNQIAAAWLGGSASITGDAVLATITFTIPQGAGSTAAYRVRFDHFSASPNGISLFDASIYAGVVSTVSRTASTAGDGIPDAWRLRWFGSATSPLSAAAADPDGDGRSNLAEYQAGTSPVDGASRLALSTAAAIGGVKLTFPTGIGRTYLLECASGLGGPWSPLSTNVGNGAPREWTDVPTGTTTRFYRVRAQ